MNGSEVKLATLKVVILAIWGSSPHAPLTGPGLGVPVIRAKSYIAASPLVHSRGAIG